MSGSNSSDSVSAADRQGAHLLGMTVHSLPRAGEAVHSAQRGRNARWKLIGLLLVCIAPVAASYFMYYVVRPDGRKNFGTLIQPQRPMPEIATLDLQGKPGKLTDLQRQWLLVSVAPGACNADCEQHLYLQRQMREALGREKDRVDWVWLVTDQTAVRPELRTGVGTADVLRVDEAALGEWLQPEPNHALSEHLYVVDPMGNWMMRFPANLDATGAARAKRDLERMLRASASWDTPGRDAKP